jgi:hypothetical protein
MTRKDTLRYMQCAAADCGQYRRCLVRLGRECKHAGGRRVPRFRDLEQWEARA